MNKTRHPVLLLLLTLIITTFAACRHKDMSFPPELKVGNNVPSFSVTALDGKTYSNKTLMASGTPFTVFIIGAKCPYCHSRTEQLRRVLPEGYPILALSKSPEDETRAFLEQYGQPFPAAVPDSYTIRLFNQKELPLLVVFGPDGKVKTLIRREEMEDEELFVLITNVN